MTLRPLASLIYLRYCGAKHKKVASGVYLNFTNQSTISSNPIWIPKKHYPKKFKQGFKKTYTTKVTLKTKDKLFIANNTICLLDIKTGLLVSKTSLENHRLS